MPRLPATTKIPPMFTRRDYGGCFVNGTCVRCGRLISEEHVMLELDQRTGEYHDFRDVPENMSQGWFEFGADCAKKLRTRARAARGE